MSTAAHERYHFKPDPGSSHSWAMQHLQRTAADSRVLDIGAGRGAIGKFLVSQGLQELYAVEIDSETREYISPIYKQVSDSLTTYSEQQFDVILLLDVLEHVTDSFTFLAEAVELLAPGGEIYISVPNVAHWSVRLQLLFGFFHYTERGILDKTHYQFFTRRRFKQLLSSEASLSLPELSVSIEPIELVLSKQLTDNCVFKACSQARLAAARLWPGMLAYQHLAKLVKP